MRRQVSVATNVPADRSLRIPRTWVHSIVLAAGVGATILVIAFAAWPSLYGEVVVEYVLLPRYEANFGFRGGHVSLIDSRDTFSLYCIEEVTPGGLLHNAGVRAGDIPVDYHDSVLTFYDALRDANEGRPARFFVIPKDGFSWDKRRVIKLSQ